MKNCPKCQAPIKDTATFCTNCGTPISQDGYQDTGAQNGMGNAYNSPKAVNSPVVYADPYDHTMEFDNKDISDNKVIAMAPYLLGIFGILIALLAAGNSPYVSFHVRQVIKFEVVSFLMWIAAIVFFWLVLPIIAAAIMSIVFFVIKIICFFQICSGKAKEPAIIRSLGFLK